MKQLLKNIFCSVLYYSGILHLYLFYVSRVKKQFPTLILTYHRFSESYDGLIDIEPAFTHLVNDFKKELNFFQRYFDIVPLDTIVDKLKKREMFQRPTVAITIDDGYKDTYELLFPILKEKNIPATIFLTAGFIGTDKKIWIDQLAENIATTTRENIRLNGILFNQTFPLFNLNQKRRLYRILINTLKEMDVNIRDKNLHTIEDKLAGNKSNTPVMLTWEQIHAMYKNNISFGAHTCTHPILTKMPLEDAKREILDSKKMIEEKLGIKVKHFAYPNGRSQDFNEELCVYCKQVGFESISSYENNGSNSRKDDIFALKRLAAYRPISVFAFNLIRNL